MALTVSRLTAQPDRLSEAPGTLFVWLWKKMKDSSSGMNTMLTMNNATKNQRGSFRTPAGAPFPTMMQTSAKMVWMTRPTTAGTSTASLATSPPLSPMPLIWPKYQLRVHSYWESEWDTMTMRCFASPAGGMTA